MRKEKMVPNLNHFWIWRTVTQWTEKTNIFEWRCRLRWISICWIVKERGKWIKVHKKKLMHMVHNVRLTSENVFLQLLCAAATPHILPVRPHILMLSLGVCLFVCLFHPFFLNFWDFLHFLGLFWHFPGFSGFFGNLCLSAPPHPSEGYHCFQPFEIQKNP